MLISGLIHLGREMPFIHGRDVQTMFPLFGSPSFGKLLFLLKEKWNHMGHDMAKKVL